MENLEERIAKAKEEDRELDRLLEDYTPFIKKQIQDNKIPGMEYDDMLSVAMLAFVNAVGQYKEGRGKFLSFAALAIKSRLIDENRKQKRYHGRVMPLYPEEDSNEQSAEEKLSLEEYYREQERLRIAEEISFLARELEHYGVGFSNLPKICPKQEKARNQCIQIAREVVENEELKEALTNGGRIKTGSLAQKFNLSVKTIEKHRKYIITVAVLLMGDYPRIRAFLPQSKEVTGR